MRQSDYHNHSIKNYMSKELLIKKHQIEKAFLSNTISDIENNALFHQPYHGSLAIVKDILSVTLLHTLLFNSLNNGLYYHLYFRQPQ